METFMQPAAAAVTFGTHRLARAVRAMPDVDGDLMMKIGQLLESTRTLGRDIQEIKQQQATNAMRAEKDRSDLHSEVSKVGDRVGVVEDELVEVKRKQTEILSRQADMQRVTDKVTRWQWAGSGAIAVTGVAFTALGWLLAHYWDRIFP